MLTGSAFPISRRQVLRSTGAGFGYLAFAGLLGDSQGYYPVFAVGAALSVLYALALALRVRDPRHAKVVNAPA